MRRLRDALDLITFFTGGETEARAWTLRSRPDGARRCGRDPLGHRAGLHPLRGDHGERSRRVRLARRSRATRAAAARRQGLRRRGRRRAAHPLQSLARESAYPPSALVRWRPWLKWSRRTTSRRPHRTAGRWTTGSCAKTARSSTPRFAAGTRRTPPPSAQRTPRLSRRSRTGAAPPRSSTRSWWSPRRARGAVLISIWFDPADEGNLRRRVSYERAPA